MIVQTCIRQDYKGCRGRLTPCPPVLGCLDPQAACELLDRWVRQAGTKERRRTRLEASETTVAQARNTIVCRCFDGDCYLGGLSNLDKMSLITG